MDSDRLLGSDSRGSSPILSSLRILQLAVGLVLMVALASAVFGVIIYVTIDSRLKVDSNEGQTLQHPINLYWAKQSIIAYRSGGQWANDMNALVQKWNSYFKARKAGDKDVVIFDIDDTVLSTYPKMVEMDFGYVAKLDEEWMMQAVCQAIPETAMFFHNLNTWGYKVIFITGRKDFLRNATALNLQRQGLEPYVELILREPQQYNMTAQAYKSEERTKLVKEGYTIVGSIGDQFSDINGPYVGYRMKVINYAYFIA